jgi:hypothetical protein
MIGGAAAALTGLVFVALTLQLERIVAHPFHRFRAGVAIAALTSQVILAGIMLLPAQPQELVGAEVFAAACAFVWIDVTAGRHPAPPEMRYAHPQQRLIVGLLLTAAFLVSGALLFFGIEDALYLLALAMGLGIGMAIHTSWDLITNLPNS